MRKFFLAFFILAITGFFSSNSAIADDMDKLLNPEKYVSELPKDYIKPIVTLKKNITITNDIITLGDIFEGDFPNKDLKIQDAPTAGKSVSIAKNHIYSLCKKLGLNWPIRSTLGFVSITRNGQIISQEEIIASINKALGKNDPDAKFELELNRSNSEVHVPVNAKYDLITDIINMNKNSDSFSAKLSVKYQNKDEEYTISGRVYKLIEIPVAARNIDINDIINSDDIEYKSIRVNKLSNRTITDENDIIRKQSKRRIKQGNSFANKDITEPVLVKKGDVVNVYYSTKFMNLTIKAIARQNGTKGQVIEILNRSTNKNIFAKVIGKNLVQVENLE